MKESTVEKWERVSRRTRYYFARLCSELGSRGGQTMTEYVLILAAIAVAGYAAYVSLEGGINTLIASVTTALSST